MSQNAYPTTPVPDVTVTGSVGALNATLELNCQGLSSAGIEISGTFLGTITFQYTIDGTNWRQANMYPIENGPLTTVLPGTGAPQNYEARLEIGEFAKARVIMTAYTSGSVTVVWLGSTRGGFVKANSYVSDWVTGQGLRVNPNWATDGQTMPLANGGGAAIVQSFNALFNGATYDQLRDSSKTGAADTAEQFMPVAEDSPNGVYATANKPLAVITYAPTAGQSFATVAANIKATPGNWKSFQASSRALTLVYFQLHDKATAPTAGNVPIFEFPINGAIAGTVTSRVVGADFFSQNGCFFVTGLSYGYSTTSGTYTAATAANHDTSYTYK